VPNFSVLDGWWREGFIAGLNGWSIGADQAWDDVNAQDAADADSFYTTLERDIVPLFYHRGADDMPHEWVKLMKNTIQTIAPKFTTRRMVKEYVAQLYLPEAARSLPEQ
jgi:starch phosphorylase